MFTIWYHQDVYTYLGKSGTLEEENDVNARVRIAGIAVIYNGRFGKSRRRKRRKKGGKARVTTAIQSGYL